MAKILVAWCTRPIRPIESPTLYSGGGLWIRSDYVTLYDSRRVLEGMIQSPGELILIKGWSPWVGLAWLVKPHKEVRAIQFEEGEILFLLLQEKNAMLERVKQIAENVRQPLGAETDPVFSQRERKDLSSTTTCGWILPTTGDRGKELWAWDDIAAPGFPLILPYRA